MSAAGIIAEAQARGEAALSEAQSKRLLAEYGVPVPTECEADTVEEALSAAEAIGFPVVIKGTGAHLTHKTELGLVALDLKTGAEASTNAARILDALAGDGRLLVQPFIEGHREFLLGLHRDPQFGPVVTFGLGGIFAETLDDVVLRTAPLGEAEAERMLDEIRGRKLLDGVRGMAPVDRPALVRALVGLARLAEDQPTVASVDVNPVIAGNDGRVLAADALVFLESGSD
jgi:succinyl-CoA synthetase beta subunit